VKERRLAVAEAQLAFAALATLVTPEPVAGAEALSACSSATMSVKRHGISDSG
jgi:hypothetical protein